MENETLNPDEDANDQSIFPKEYPAEKESEGDKPEEDDSEVEIDDEELMQG